MGKKSKILVVDNHEEIREVLAGVLEALSYDTCSAGGYREAMEQIDQSDLCAVVTDVEMHPETGFDLLAACREKHPELPVIMVSSYADEKMRQKALQGGATDFLGKPFTMADLHDALERGLQV